MTSKLEIPAPHGHLEAAWQPVENAKGLALVCHPHPKLGGNMQNTATHRLARAWNDAGYSALRFNFRGVGASTGQIVGGDGEEELEDAIAALTWLQAQGSNLWLSGFSFGSRTALQLAIVRPGFPGVIAVGYAAGLFDNRFLSALKTKTAFVHADHDEYASLAQIEALRAQMTAPNQLYVVENSDHLASGRLDALSKQLGAAIAWLTGGSA
jgi:uncharacterized protein